ncbi:RagB/SusD family nutrient uptake outer membrane protein [Limibacter armeniacum]|uniref:RagB/SusD family nutrient uptake outer membrane protein n=1 Tax=Limibacter armeniacum TaxID=466084 RepID=UPI002FE67367
MKALSLIKNIFTLSLLLLFMTACNEDFLELEPTDSISEGKVFESYTIAEAALVGAYDQLSNPSFEGLYVPIMADIIGEDVMINAVDNWNWFVPVYQMNVLPNYTYVNSPWWAGYKLIYDVNKLIKNVQKIPDATADQKNRLEGEARALRAFVMLKLAQIYSPAYSKDNTAPSILLVTDILEADDDDIGRSTLKEVYEQIENDLLTAISLLEEKKDKGFVDQRAAKAMLARTYLDMENWQKARDMAKEAYEGLELMSISEMYSGFSTRNSETIFTIAYTQEDNNVYLSLPSFYWPVGGYSSMRANDQFVDLFNYQDARGGFFLQQDDIDAERFLILKFGHNNVVGNAERISIRASEMYLIEAECEAELGNYTAAQEALYQIQQRSYPGVQKSKATDEQLVNEILLERRKELFGEGFRWNDIKRRQQSFSRGGDHWVTFNYSPADADYYRLTFPIPQSEIDANKMIDLNDQNEGY